MKYLYAFIFCLLIAGQVRAQEASKVTCKFYGFVRGDAAIDTRRCVAATEGLFLLYPSDIMRDPLGEDLNAVASSKFYAFNSRAGVEAAGLKLWGAETSALLEADFAGFSHSYGTSSTVLRIRQAHIKMRWQHSDLVVGQAWHPMFGQVIPGVLSLSAGAPFNPFSRCPQVRFDYKAGKFDIYGAAIWQFQFNSSGPAGKSPIYQRDAVTPELFLGLDFSTPSFRLGGGADWLTIASRTQSATSYKVNESLSSLSYFAYARYTTGLFSAAAKAVYGQNLSDLTTIGGYGVSAIDPATGEQQYTNFNHLSSWLNLSYGKKYLVNVFGGYVKNLGTNSPLTGSTYGEGLGLDALWRLSGAFSYNVAHFSLGAEYELTSAAYGDSGTFNAAKGTYATSHAVANHRVTCVINYFF